jgi:hypothetical protein
VIGIAAVLRRLHQTVPYGLAAALLLSSGATSAQEAAKSPEAGADASAPAASAAPAAPAVPATSAAPAVPATSAAPAEVRPATAAKADPPLVPISVGAFTGALHASYRLLGWAQPGLQLGRRDTTDPIDTLGKKTFLEHRLRVGGDLRNDSGLDLRFEADVLNGLFAALPGGYVLAPQAVPAGGAPQPLLAEPLRNRAWGVNPSSFALRELALRWRGSAGQLTFGATTFSFGQGMLSSPANNPVDAEAGDQRFGDRVVRLAFSTRPLLKLLGPDAPDLTVAIGADLVLQDSTATLFRPFADWSDKGAIQDKAYGGILALVHKAEGREVGLVITRRKVNTPDSPVLLQGTTIPFSTDLSVWAFDGAAKVEHKLAGMDGSLAAEGALVLGDTNRVRNATCTGGAGSDRCKIFQGGAVVRGGLDGALLGFDLLLGFASGDADPFDDQINNFKLSRDFPVGMILFDQVIAWQSAAAVRRATDPLLSNAPAPGIDLLSTNGAVTNALFVQPTLKVKVAEGLQLWGSLLWAVAPQPVADPYWTLKSGAITNAFGQPAGKGYGLELDAGVNYKRALTPGLNVHAGLAGGVFLPGDAFVVDAAGTKMDAVARVKARAAVWF